MKNGVKSEKSIPTFILWNELSPVIDHVQALPSLYQLVIGELA